MKRFYPCLLLLVLGASCAKTNYQYAVVCDCPDFYGGQTWLVVTDDAGSILKVFDLPAGRTQFVGKFDYEAREAAETYNLHLVYKSDTLYSLSSVFSHYGIQNGAAVSFLPAALYSALPNYTSRQLLISGLEAVDSIIIPGAYFNGWGYDANNKTAYLALNYIDESDLVIRVRTAPFTPFRSLYVPTTTLTSDSVVVQWADFSQDNHFTTVEPPENEAAINLEVTAVAPDFKRFAMVFYHDSFSLPLALPMQIPLPTGLHSQSLFRVRMQQGDITTEKMFAPGQALRLEASPLSIKTASFSPFQSLQIATGGNPDLIEAHAYTYGPVPPIFFVDPPSFQWNIQGPPESFAKMIIPDLTELLPELHSLGPQPILWRVTAYKYDHLDFDQLLAGFPYKGSDGRVFPIARSGLQMVTKNY